MTREVDNSDYREVQVTALDTLGTLESKVFGDSLSAAIAAPWDTYGVIRNRGNQFQVTPGTGLSVNVGTGQMILGPRHGQAYFVNAIGSVNRVLTATGAGEAGPIVTAITARFNKTQRLFTYDVSQRGTAGGGNPANTFTSADDFGQIIAFVSIAPGATTITAGNITMVTDRFGALEQPPTQESLSKTDYRHLWQKPSTTNTVEFYNDRGGTRNPTKKWVLNSSNELIEYINSPYGWVENKNVEAREFGTGHAGKPLLPYYDAQSRTQWAAKGTRGHIVESDTEANVTTGSNDIPVQVLETGSTLQLSNFGDRRGIGIQSGTNYYIVGNPSGNGSVGIG